MKAGGFGHNHFLMGKLNHAFETDFINQLLPDLGMSEGKAGIYQ